MREKPSKTDLMSVAEASALLGVCGATLRNWARAGIAEPVEGARPLSFRARDVKRLKRDVEDGKLDRLRRRANKTSSEKTALHRELFSDEKDRAFVGEIVAQIAKNKTPRDVALCAIAANLASSAMGVSLYDFFYTPREDNADFRKIELLRKEINDWIREPGVERDVIIRNPIEGTPGGGGDILGGCYQALSSVGKKGKAGAYYTPGRIADAMAREHVRGARRVMDPCCGTGRFLLAALERLKAEGVKYPLSLIRGIDSDRAAARVARINLLLSCPAEYAQAPDVRTGDALLAGSKQTDARDDPFDVVLSNPPWGARRDKDARGNYRRVFPEIKSGETFSCFIRLGHETLRENGRLSFILPQSILNVKTHGDVREFISNSFVIDAVHELGRAFSGVFTTAVRLDLIKKKPVASDSFTVYAGSKITNRVRQLDMKRRSDFKINLIIRDEDFRIIDKVYAAKHVTLKGNADWALGIVTGDNKRFVSGERIENSEPALRGKEIFKYTCGDASSCVVFEPERFQQCAKEKYFRAKEKLIYRFISNQPVFAYDNQKRLTLNSANILIPRFADVSMKYVMAVLNSSLLQYLFQKEFSAIKILRGDLEALPIPLFPESLIDSQIEILLNKEDTSEARKEAFNNIDLVIYQSCGLSASEIALIARTIKKAAGN